MTLMLTGLGPYWPRESGKLKKYQQIHFFPLFWGVWGKYNVM